MKKFADRIDAARQLAEALGGELDVVLARKLRALGNPELSVDQFYREFPQVEDDEVVRMLGEARHQPS